MSEKVICKICYDWWYATGYHEVCQIYEIGIKTKHGTPIKIEEHPYAGEGDKWYYDIIFDNGKIIRTFNPNEVVYA